MKSVIMVLGAGIMQLPAFKAAGKNGWTIIAADGNPQAPCRELADHFVEVDLKDRTGLAREARRFQESIGLDGVFTCGTDFSTSVAWVAEQLGLPGISYQTALNCTDKVRMRSVFRDKGVPCPQFVEISAEMDLAREVSPLTFPVVVKPVDNMGGRGVVKVAGLSGLADAVAEAIAFSRTDRAIVEEFMEGPEFSIDSLIYKGKLRVTGFADRHIFFPPCFIEMGHTLPTALSPADREEVVRVFTQAVEALGIDLGAAKGDIKLTPRGVMIGEIAARLSGGYMSGWTYPYASGVPLVEKGMLIAMGRNPELPEAEENRCSSERAFLSIPGKIREIRGIQEAHDAPGIRDLFLRVEEGDAVDFPVNNIGKCGNVIALADSRREALAASEGAVKKIRILLEEEAEETRAFLEGPLAGEFPPSAYDADCLSWCPLGEMEGFKPDFSLRYALHPLPRPRRDDPLLNRKDWHGVTLAEALEEVLGPEAASQEEVPRWTLFAKHFWHALLRGGIQGALWFLGRNEHDA